MLADQKKFAHSIDSSIYTVVVSLFMQSLAHNQLCNLQLHWIALVHTVQTQMFISMLLFALVELQEHNRKHFFSFIPQVFSTSSL